MTEQFGKFKLVERLGAGAMGEVWKAWDPTLNRWIALKLLKVDDEEERARFEREAQSAGRLNHPNIAAIYEVGELNGRRFIAMQFVPGATLKGRAIEPRLAARYVRDAARAVHVAHVAGVIHRDVKPENLMVAEGHLYVMDFGLARPSGGESSLSLPGTIIGTPSYMSPEQARGETAEIRSDVFSLGATLHTLISGRPPYMGRTVFDVIRKVQEEEPAALQLDRKSGELQVIVTKCMEKDPNRRYTTAAELADDLDRWMEGEPLRARRAGVVYRVGKKLRKMKAPVIAGIGGIIVAVLLAVLIPRLKSGPRDVTASQEELLAKMRESAAVSLAAIQTLRETGRVEGMEKHAVRLEETCRKVIEARPTLAEPHYRLGRMYRAMMKMDRAKHEQEIAIRKDPAFGPSLYECFMLRHAEMTAYGKVLVGDALRLEGLQARDGGITPEKSTISLVTVLRDDDEGRRMMQQCDSLLERIEKSRAGVSNEQLTCARAFRFNWNGDRDGARKLLSAALAGGSLPEEGIETLAGLEWSEGRLEESERLWTIGIERDRGYIPFYEGRAAVRQAAGQRKKRAGGDPTAEFESAEADSRTATRIDPRHVAAWVGMADARFGLVGYYRARDVDIAPLVWAIKLHIDEALRLDPESYQAHLVLGAAYGSWAGQKMARSEDPWEEFRVAEEAFTKAIRIDPNREFGWRYRANIHAQKATVLRSRGMQPLDEHQAALDDLAQALKLNPRDYCIWADSGINRMTMGLMEFVNGRDPMPHYTRALSDLSESTRYHDRDAEVWQYRGVLLLNIADYYRLSGREDPESMYRDAIHDLKKALDLGHAHVHPNRQLGLAFLNWANWIRKVGKDPSDRLESAAQNFREAIRRNPESVDNLRNLSEVQALQAMAAGQKGEDALPLFRAALATADEAIQKQPRDALCVRYRATAWHNLGIYLKSRGKPHAEAVKFAIADYRRTAVLDPTLAGAMETAEADCRKLTVE